MQPTYIMVRRRTLDTPQNQPHGEAIISISNAEAIISLGLLVMCWALTAVSSTCSASTEACTYLPYLIVYLRTYANQNYNFCHVYRFDIYKRKYSKQLNHQYMYAKFIFIYVYVYTYHCYVYINAFYHAWNCCKQNILTLHTNRKSMSIHACNGRSTFTTVIFEGKSPAILR